MINYNKSNLTPITSPWIPPHFELPLLNLPFPSQPPHLRLVSDQFRVNSIIKNCFMSSVICRYQHIDQLCTNC